MSNLKKPAGKRIDIKGLLNPTFSVPVRGKRLRMPAYEVALRKQVKDALAKKDPKAIHELINIFIEHKVLEPDSEREMPPVYKTPWYYDFQHFLDYLDECEEAGKALRYKPKFIEPLTEAGRKDMEEQEAILTKRSNRKEKMPGVGYQNPPIKNRFKKGTSGNPRGRPAAKNDRRAIVTRVGNDKISMTENGITRELRIVEALLVAIRSLAIQGNGAKYYTTAIKNLLPEDPDRTWATFFLPDSPPLEEWAAMVLKQQQELMATDPLDDLRKQLKIEK